MKLWFGVIDDVGNVHRKVMTGSPEHLLQCVFVCLPTGEFDLSKPCLSDRIKDVDAAFYSYMKNFSAVESIDRIKALLTHKDRNERVAERLAEDLMIFGLADDGPELVTFLEDLRAVFSGDAQDVCVVTDDQTTMIVRIEA